GPCLSRELQLRPTGEPLTAQKRAALLYRLRATPNVASAGPLLTWQTHTVALQPQVEVQLGNLSLDQCVEWIENTGLNGTLSPNSHNVMVQLTRGSGLSAVTVAERLLLDPNVVSVSNVLGLLDEPG
ncbi:MAG: hypothetical protein AB8H79_23935, partial [Myxococcota bacterium]